MIDNPITRKCLEDGLIKKGAVFMLNKQDGMIWSFKVKLISWRKRGGDIVVKLKTYKDYPFGHKIIYRNLTELI